MSNEVRNAFSSTLRPMSRNLPTVPPKYPMHTVHSRSSQNASGLTISEEEVADSTANAEYEVLRSIVSREQYLERLQQAVRTVGRTFKQEVADVLDLVRIASLDVVERIVVWRNAKVLVV